ncbi:hypothetical protein BV898_08935 [Hypsibius exemplaris]|uniref:Receptor ligand binding region domain-containing protein n=1 Tax=Hypsibius exemplaris TaxID=2072580 RepID=A0A1W0WP25_HYPEX|nr:hypothetical protein BV898_08935 [Hypsibius exemplaris]
MGLLVVNAVMGLLVVNAVMGLFMVLGILFFGASCSADPILIRIGSLGPHETRDNAVMSTAPYQMAAKDFGRRTNYKFNLTLTFLHTRPAETRQIDCLYRGDDADQTIAEWYYGRREDEHRLASIPAGLIQTGCIDLSTVHLLATEWNILSLTSVASQRDPKVVGGSTSFFLGSVSVSTFVEALRNLFRLHDWTSVYMLLDDTSGGFYGAVFQELLVGAANGTAGSASGLYRLRTTIKENTRLEPFLAKFYAVSRVCLFLGHAAKLRRLMLTAHRLNMTNGEYVYLAMEPLSNAPVRVGILDWRYNLTDDADAKEAFRSLLVVHQYVSPTSKSYAAVEALGVYRRRLAAEYNLSASADVMAQAHLAGVSLKDAQSLAKLFLLNRSVHLDAEGMTDDFYIDSYGQRRSDLAISYFGGSLTTRKPFLVQYAKVSPEFSSAGGIEWVGGKPWPPPNVPRCGYLGDDPACQTNTAGREWTGGAVVFCLALAAATCAIFRKLRRAASAICGGSEKLIRNREDGNRGPHRSPPSGLRRCGAGCGAVCRGLVYTCSTV